MQKDQLTQIIYSYFDAWNRADTDAIVSFFSDQGVYVDTALNQEYKGHQIARYINRVLFESSATLRFSIIEKPVISDDVVFLRSSLKVISENSERQFESAELFKFLDGKLILVQTYYDLGHEKEALTQDEQKYAKSGLDEKQVLEVKQQLEALMKAQQPFRDPALKLQDLSDLLDLRRNQLSLILNVEYQMKFFDFINKYRLEAFISELHRNTEPDINITALAYQAGFSSSSVFYKIFRRYQDISPKKYIQKHCANLHLSS